MRPEGRSELDSLYFDYPLFEAPDIAIDDTATTVHPVVIVGAGPIGMAATLTLARYGIKSILLEHKNTFNDGSRAICISRSSFYALERMGAHAPFLEKSLGWTTGRGYFRGREIGQFEMPHSDDDKYLPMYNLQQQYIEQFLHQAVIDSGMVDMRWQSELVGLESADDHVRLRISSPKGDYDIKAQYYLAADGARSPTREMMGLRLKGKNLEGRYVIADIQMEHDFPTERRALFEPDSNPDGTVLIHRQPGNIWRIDYQLEADEDEDEAIKEQNIRAKVSAILKDIDHEGPWELEWWSIYSANTLCLDNYRHGRVFFIGDSAHIVPIFGVRGLNNGILDAENIGWKLARVLNGIASEKLLDSYSPERHGATLDVFAHASKSAAFMTPPTSGHALMRRAALSLSLSQSFARPLSNPRNMTPYNYVDSPLTRKEADNSSFRVGPAPGAVCPDIHLAGGRFLLDKMGKGYTAILFSDDDGIADEIRCLGQALDVDFVVIQICKSSETAILDSNGRITELFDAGPGSCYLLRPDQYVAARWKTAIPADIINFITN